MSKDEIPEMFNGKPTHYEWGDGYDRSSRMMKILYLAFPGYGIEIENKFKKEARENAKLAKEAMEKQKSESSLEAAETPNVSTQEKVQFLDAELERREALSAAIQR